MVHEALVQMNLQSAFLCAEPDCQTVSNDSGSCPRCYSQVLSLAQVLDGKKGAIDAETRAVAETSESRGAA